MSARAPRPAAPLAAPLAALLAAPLAALLAAPLAAPLAALLLSCASAPPPPPPLPPSVAAAPLAAAPARGARGEDAGGAVTPEGLKDHLRAALAAEGCAEAGALLERTSGLVDRYVDEATPFLSYLAHLKATDARVRVQRAELLADFSAQVLRRYGVLEQIARACPPQRAALARYRDALAHRLSGLMSPEAPAARAPSP